MGQLLVDEPGGLASRSRVRLSYTSGLLKGRNNTTTIIVQPTTCDMSHRKNYVLARSATLLNLCKRGGMKSSKMRKGRNVSKKVGNHWARGMKNLYFKRMSAKG